MRSAVPVRFHHTHATRSMYQRLKRSLGTKKAQRTWEAKALSVDQTGKNKEEIGRFCEEHLGEEDMVKNGRVLGLAVSRAFGGCQWR